MMDDLPLDHRPPTPLLMATICQHLSGYSETHTRTLTLLFQLSWTLNVNAFLCIHADIRSTQVRSVFIRKLLCCINSNYISNGLFTYSEFKKSWYQCRCQDNVLSKQSFFCTRVQCRWMITRGLDATSLTDVDWQVTPTCNSPAVTHAIAVILISPVSCHLSSLPVCLR